MVMKLDLSQPCPVVYLIPITPYFVKRNFDDLLPIQQTSMKIVF